jgi:hypothetical protein
MDDAKGSVARTALSPGRTNTTILAPFNRPATSYFKWLLYLHTLCFGCVSSGACWLLAHLPLGFSCRSDRWSFRRGKSFPARSNSACARTHFRFCAGLAASCGSDSCSCCVELCLRLHMLFSLPCSCLFEPRRPFCRLSLPDTWLPPLMSTRRSALLLGSLILLRTSRYVLISVLM